jgi:hypothetical protein
MTFNGHLDGSNFHKKVNQQKIAILGEILLIYFFVYAYLTASTIFLNTAG